MNSQERRGQERGAGEISRRDRDRDTQTGAQVCQGEERGPQLRNIFKYLLLTENIFPPLAHRAGIVALRVYRFQNISPHLLR